MRQTSDVMSDDVSNCAHYAILYDDEKLGGLELHDADDVHRNWMLLDSSDNPIVPGSKDGDDLFGAVIDISKSRSNFILVSGLGLFESANCYYSKALQTVLLPSRNVNGFETMDFDKSALITQLLSGQFTCCTIFGIGANGPSCLKEFYHREDLRCVLVKFVEAGGVLIAQGEGVLLKIFQDWFGLPWKQSTYTRDALLFFQQFCSLYHPRAAANQSIFLMYRKSTACMPDKADA